MPPKTTQTPKQERESTKIAALHLSTSKTLYRKGTKVLALVNTPKGYAKVQGVVVRSYPYPTKANPICVVVHVDLDDGRSLRLTADRITKGAPR